MFGRKNGLARARQTVEDAGSDARKAMGSKKPNKVDSVTAAALLLGFANWASVSLFNFDAVQAVAKKKSIPGRAAYGFLGLSAVYASIRGARGVK